MDGGNGARRWWASQIGLLAFARLCLAACQPERRRAEGGLQVASADRLTGELGKVAVSFRSRALKGPP